MKSVWMDEGLWKWWNGGMASASAERARKTDTPPGHMHTNQRARARFMPDWSHWTTV